MEDNSKRQVVRVSLLKQAGYLVLGTAGLAGGLLLVVGPTPFVWLVGGISFSLVVLVMLVSGLGALDLVLTDEAFIVGTLFGRHHYPWEEVGRFRVIQQGGRKVVGFNYVPGSDKATRGRRAGLPKECDNGVVNLYPMTPEELATLLNEWKSRRVRGVDA